MSTTNESQPLVTMSLTADTVVGTKNVVKYLDGGSYTQDEPMTLAELVVERFLEELRPTIRKELRDSVLKLIDQEVRNVAREQVEQLVGEALNGEFHSVNEYGEPRGPKVTLRTMIGQSAQTWMTRDRYGKNPLKEFIDDAVSRQFRAELAEHVASARDALRKRMTDVGAKMLAEAIEKGYGK